MGIHGVDPMDVCTGHMVAEPEYEWRGAQLYDLGQGELDGCGVALANERRRSVLQGVGGDAVGCAKTCAKNFSIPPCLKGALMR